MKNSPLYVAIIEYIYSTFGYLFDVETVEAEVVVRGTRYVLADQAQNKYILRNNTVGTFYFGTEELMETFLRRFVAEKTFVHMYNKGRLEDGFETGEFVHHYALALHNADLVITQIHNR